MLVAAFASLLAACAPAPEPTSIATDTPLPITPVILITPPTPTPAPKPITLNLIWNLHQPFHPTDPQTGLVSRPWTRVHATKDYTGIAALLKQYPNVKATFNLTPLLVRQLDDLANGARDTHWELAARPANQLGEADKRFILTRFFDAPPQAFNLYPRYKELLDKRGDGESEEKIAAALQTFTEQDFRDLQVWFNLAWFDHSLLVESPLKELVAKGRDYTEEDKPIVFGRALEVIRSVIPLYRGLQDNAQIELTAAPYANPILPLLIDSNLQRGVDLKTKLPQPSFTFPADANEQVSRGVQAYAQRFGRPPRGLLPAGGAVAENMLQPMARSGAQWMATGEDVLAKSLNLNSFERDANGLVQNADALYRPYAIDTSEGRKMFVVFGDRQLSELVRNGYARNDAEAAAQGFIDRVLSIKAQLRDDNDDNDATESRLITIILDTAGVWDNYADDGAAFTDALIRKLSEAADRGEIQTMTPSEYLAKFPEQRALDRLAPGALDGTGFGAWIGHPQQNAAWDYLRRARRFLEDYLKGNQIAEPSAIAQAYEAMLLAESSDWLRAYGSDTTSQDGDAGYFDDAFRSLLSRVYASLGAPKPDYVDVPIIQARAISETQPMQGVITPTIDGSVDVAEWDVAGQTHNTRQVDELIGALAYGTNGKNLFFRVDATQDWNTIGLDRDALQPQALRVGIYLKLPGYESGAPLTRLGPEDVKKTPLGMNASHLVEWTFEADGTSSATVYSANSDGAWLRVAPSRQSIPAAAMTGNVLEISAPLGLLGGANILKPGGVVPVAVVVSQAGRVLSQFPRDGLAQMNVPATLAG
jgi:alpha-amylase/alpha-mannosidase (GH57 family)